MTRRDCVQGIPEAVSGPARESSVPPFVLSKMVLTLSTFTSAVFSAFCDVRCSN